VRHAVSGQSIRVREKHAGAGAVLCVPAGAHRALHEYLLVLDPPSPPADMYLFAGQRGWSPLTTERLDEMVSEWARAAGLQGHYGAHSLRKTFGYLQRMRFGVDLELLARRLGYSSAAATRRYLGLTADDAAGACLAEI
jgi:site-specific recombinase XerD